ncbi:hypothetical protein [Burkholderia stagnalis]|uniref:Uncharacterized protein n=1 Tax=Burkholderia stagnalis TaxID=1503054 RepID=A0A6L3N118_9BURK|nr:hypothetical protein [Burkholderia stagnalis]KAB0638471.1 hypothetical protein F7R25_11880 [Burkholderia stagnalis]
MPATDFKPTPQSQSKRVSCHPIRTGFARREAEQAEAARAKNVSPAIRAKGARIEIATSLSEPAVSHLFFIECKRFHCPRLVAPEWQHHPIRFKDDAVDHIAVARAAMIEAEVVIATSGTCAPEPLPAITVGGVARIRATAGMAE